MKIKSIQKNLIKRVVLVLAILFQNCLYAQSSFLSEKSLSSELPYAVQIWNTENGLPQNSVNSITQTLNGYIWLATFDGLVRFDGVKFTVYNTANTSSLKSNYIREVFSDKNGGLWVATSNDILKYENNEFLNFGIETYASDVDFCDGKNGAVYINIQSHGLYEYKNDKLSKLENVTNLSIDDIAFSQNELYLATDNGLYIYSRDLKLRPTIKGFISFIEKSKKEGEFWIVNSGKLLKIKDGEIITSEFEKILPIEANIQGISYVNKDLTIISSLDKIFIHHNKELFVYDETTGLSENKLLSVFSDVDNNIWIGTYTSGLNMLSKKAFQSFTKDEGLSNESATSITQSRDSSVLVGYRCDGVYEVTQDGQLKNKILVGNNCILTLLKDKEGGFWAGTAGRGIFYNSSNGKQTHYSISKTDSTQDILSIYQDSGGKIWAGTSSGLYYFEKEKFVLMKTPHEKYDHVCYIMEDNKKRIWYGSHKGIGIIKGEKHTFLTTKNGLSNNKIREIYEDESGVFWIGTYGGGLNRYKDEVFYSYGNQNGLLNENVSCIIEDEFGYLWMSSNNGLYRVEKQSLNDLAEGKTKVIKSRVFVKQDGIKNIEFNGGAQPAVWEDFYGNFWFPTISGVVKGRSLNPTMEVKSTVLIENVTVDGKNVKQGENIEIKSSVDEVEISYTLPSFSSPKSIRFQYKLEGLNSNWINAGSRRKAYFSNIPGGEYVFKVRTYNNPEKVASFSFVVPIVFWETLWFYFLLGIITVLIITFLALLRVRNIKKKSIAKTKQNKKFAEMELTALRAQMNPHFIFNCLNTIKFFVSTNDEVSASKYLNKFSKLMRMFLEHSKSSFITLNDEIDLLTLYIELENLRFNNHFEFQLKLQPSLNLSNIEIPSMLFQPFVENAINHGLLSLKRKGKLTIDVHQEGLNLIGIIEDDGIGRVKAGELKDRLKKSHISRGLQITNERIQVLNTVKNIDIKIDTIDKIDENGNAAGTKVIITIPI